MDQESILPAEVGLALREEFSFPVKHLFGAVATVRDNHPSVRTMRIYEVTPQGWPVLVTHTGSNKWKEFVQHPHASINLVSENKLVQLIVFGALRLDTIGSGFDRVNPYWKMVRPDVKKIYDPAYTLRDVYSEVEGLTIPRDAPDTFGVVHVIPSFWEVLHLGSEYTRSHRYQFHLSNGKWQKQRVPVG